MNFSKIILVTVLIFITGTDSMFAQVKTKNKQAALSTVLPVDSSVRIGKLSNGFTYYIRKNIIPQKRAYLYLVNKVGSVLEDDDQQGLAHFTEHMAFNGTTNFPQNTLIDYLQKAGVRFGADLNAYTSFDETVYMLPVPTDSVNVFEKGFTILADWSGRITFDTNKLNNERGVILEESRLRGKNSGERLQAQIFPVILNNSRYAMRLPIGKDEVIKTFRPQAMTSFYHDWYRPNLQAIIAVGDFDPARVEQLIKENFSSFKNPPNEKPRLSYGVEKTNGTVVKYVTDKELPYNYLQIIVKHPEKKDNTIAGYMEAQKVILFNRMLNIRLQELQEKPSPPVLDSRSSYGPFIGHLDAFTTTAVVKPGRWKEAVKAVIGETERLRKFGFTPTELARAKQTMITNTELAMVERDKLDSRRYVSEYLRHFLVGEAIPGIAYEAKIIKENIDKIKLNDVNVLAGKFMSEENRNIIIQSPEKDKDKVPSEKDLLSWIKDAGKNVTAYIDETPKEGLIVKLSQGSKIGSEQKDDSIGTKTLTLGNGVKIILKHTDFNNDYLSINGSSPGGLTLADDDEYSSASMALEVIFKSGLGNLSSSQLRKYLTGKNASVGATISQTSQGVLAQTNEKDIELALQQIYLRFTAPRIDTTLWKSSIEERRLGISNKGISPTDMVADTMSALLTNYNSLRTLNTEENLKKASPQKALQFYKNRFANAANFTFVVVGNFNEEKIKPLLEKYLGALPSSGNKETAKDRGTRPVQGQVAKTIYSGIGDKSSVDLVYHGSYDYTDANNMQLKALTEILKLKMLERLRQKEGGIYSTRIYVSYKKIPYSDYRLFISFSCAPENVNRLIAAALDEIEKIKQNGADPSDIQKFVAEENRVNETTVKNNRFWEGYLMGTIADGEDPHRILNYTKILNQVTVESVKEAANKYLSGINLIKLVSMPEKYKGKE